MTDEAHEEFLERSRRVDAADAEAEAVWKVIDDFETDEGARTAALIAIAAELRAARIAQRPRGGS